MWIKICGVTSVADATMIAAADASAIGLNFYRKSKRFVLPDAARPIRDTVAGQLEVVGVFVNAPVKEIIAITNDVGLDCVQFHGDESTDTIATFHQSRPEVGIIRAFRVGSEGTSAMAASLEELALAGVPLRAVLADALVAGQYGGTGHQVDPYLMQNRPVTWPPLILAGGLTPTTVDGAVRAVRPWGIDTASGVELSPGVKCPKLVQQFVRAISDSLELP